VVGLVIYYSEQYGIDPALPLAIVKCESNFERYAKNPNSSAKSYFQFINGTWKYTMGKMGLATSTDVFDTDTHIMAGVWLLANEGERHWSESKACWSKSV